MQVLEKISCKKPMDRDLILAVARTSLATKVNAELAAHLAEVGYYDCVNDIAV